MKELCNGEKHNFRIKFVILNFMRIFENSIAPTLVVGAMEFFYKGVYQTLSSELKSYNLHFVRKLGNGKRPLKVVFLQILDVA